MMRVRVATTGWAGSPGLNCFYFKDDVAENAGARAGALDRVLAFFDTIAASFDGTWRANVDGVVDILDPANGEISGVLAGSTPSTVSGTRSGAGYSPPATQAIVTWATTGYVGGRNVKGRSFIGPVPRDSIDMDGTLLGAFQSALDGAADALADNGATTTAMVVWSRPRLDRPAVGALPHLTARDGSAHLVTGHQVKDKWGVLRSRRD